MELNVRISEKYVVHSYIHIYVHITNEEVSVQANLYENMLFSALKYKAFYTFPYDNDESIKKPL